MKVLVTGDQDFIGGHVADNLLAHDREVVIFDRRLSLFLGSITSREAVSSAVEACDAFVNLAGLLGTSELLKRADNAVRVKL